MADEKDESVIFFSEFEKSVWCVFMQGALSSGLKAGIAAVKADYALGELRARVRATNDALKEGGPK